MDTQTKQSGLSKKQWWIIVIVVALAAAAAYASLVKNDKEKVDSLSDAPVDFTDIISQGGKVEIDEIDSAVTTPNLDYKVAFKATMDPEVKKLMLQKITALQAEIKKDGKNFNTWNSLAMYYQTVEDYQAAKEVWEYLAVAFPTNYVAFGNLGFLYGYYLKDSVKAEQYFLKAIANGPSQVYLYYQTAEFYRDVVKSKAKALLIAEKGLATNPGNTELSALIQSLK